MCPPDEGGCPFSLFPDPPPKRKGESGRMYRGLAVSMDSAKSKAIEVSCWASVRRSIKV